MNAVVKPKTEAVNRFFKSKDAHVKFVKEFKRVAKCKAIHDGYMFLLRNIVLNKPLINGFTPIESVVKLSNGQQPYQAFQEAYFDLVDIVGGKLTKLICDLDLEDVERINILLNSNEIQDYVMKVNNG